MESSLNEDDKIVASVVENQDEDRLGEQDNNNKNRTCIRKKGDIWSFYICWNNGWRIVSWCCYWETELRIKYESWKYSTDVGTMDQEVESSTVSDQQNKKSVGNIH